ncbi:hypothetical protein pEaSNUABM37_00102 [Erwinia phage pEa_SNUABM_37]|nr:hypothetical protein pEaSNUABM37_00102 [Erwinia phage pEa_SNUABM_37]QXO10572.1 hypothetical protein pEaSNUABM48_00102 [Erwinia phage pEa_SNUABM_48]
MSQALNQELFTQVFINGARFDPISVGISDQTVVEGQPGALDFPKAVDLLKEAYNHRHNPERDKIIILGMLDTIKAELPTANLHYSRSISLGDVTLQYTVAVRPAKSAE